MAKKKAAKARKPVKFKTVTFRITARQKKSLVNYCKSRHTTPNKLIKKAIGPFLEKYSDLEVIETKREKLKQLQLF
jgi:hypothetical protein